ncbi:MAG: hypothetical protein DHS20C16_06750 [Phycisphaerae bacterium]|nr:MAG: hypothetical protein DHS20C16_06750 [Phycisphaerae bacterium]
MLEKNEAWMRDHDPSALYSSYIHRWRVERITELMKPIAGNVLDIGCFDGTIAGKLIEQGNKQVYGVDRMGSALKLAAAKGVKTYELDIDEQNTDFENEFFDATLATGVLDSLYDPDGVVEEIHRVLKPGGTLIVSLPNLACLSNRTLMFFGNPPWQVLSSAREGLGTLRHFNMAVLTELLRKKGFSITHRESNAVVFPFVRFGFNRFPILRNVFGSAGTWDRKRIFFCRTLAKLFPNLGERLLVVAVKK